MIVMPLTGYDTRPRLVDASVVPVIISAVFALVFSFSVPFVIKSTYAHSPYTGTGKQCTGQGMAANQVKSTVPETPVKYPMQHGKPGIGNRTPFLILLVTICHDAGMPHQLQCMFIIFLT